MDETKPMSISEIKRWAWNPDKNANETFEDIASWFYDETGYLRPGKSYPCAYPAPEDRQLKWDEWRQQKAREFLAGIHQQVELADELAAALQDISEGVAFGPGDVPMGAPYTTKEMKSIARAALQKWERR